MPAQLTLAALKKSRAEYKAWLWIEPNLIQDASAVGAAFVASLVECVEALTIVLAVASVRGWFASLVDASCGTILLAASIVLAGGAVVRVPLNDLHILSGAISRLRLGESWWSTINPMWRTC